MKITNAKLKQIIKEELENILNEQSSDIVGSINYAAQQGVYEIFINLPKGRDSKDMYGDPIKVNDAFELRISNLPLRNDLAHSATMISNAASKEGRTIDRGDILRAIESGKIKLPKDMKQEL